MLFFEFIQNLLCWVSLNIMQYMWQYMHVIISSFANSCVTDILFIFVGLLSMSKYIYMYICAYILHIQMYKCMGWAIIKFQPILQNINLYINTITNLINIYISNPMNLQQKIKQLHNKLSHILYNMTNLNLPQILEIGQAYLNAYILKNIYVSLSDVQKSQAEIKTKMIQAMVQIMVQNGQVKENMDVADVEVIFASIFIVKQDDKEEIELIEQWLKDAVDKIKQQYKHQTNKSQEYSVFQYTSSKIQQNNNPSQHQQTPPLETNPQNPMNSQPFSLQFLLQYSQIKPNQLEHKNTRQQQSKCIQTVQYHQQTNQYVYFPYNQLDQYMATIPVFRTQLNYLCQHYKFLENVQYQRYKYNGAFYVVAQTKLVSRYGRHQIVLKGEGYAVNYKIGCEHAAYQLLRKIYASFPYVWKQFMRIKMKKRLF